MKFEAREVKPYAEPVIRGDLRKGEVYFSVTFLDDRMLIPVVEPLVFVGEDLEADDYRVAYFQDVESYRGGVRYGGIQQGGQARFVAGNADELAHLFEFDRALDVLMLCALRRKQSRER